jgi:hypothetical protein
MARETHDRENLLRDAVALVPRVMMRVQMRGRSVEVFAGYRGESLSLYFDDDPVYHFNDIGELRRAYVDGRLIKAERGQLVLLVRKQTECETVLVRHAAGEESDRRLVAELSAILHDLAAEVSDNRMEVVGQIPDDGDGVKRLSAWLTSHTTPVIAASPHVG